MSDNQNTRLCWVGIDTSNYTTSAAACTVGDDGQLTVIANCKCPLPVAEGARGLRQSDAVFAHVKNLPLVIRDLRGILEEGSYRIAAVGVLGWYIHTMIQKQSVRTGYLTTIAMVIAGALGNIIDCVCYGKIWDYAGWFHGRVVDMLYFPLIRNAAGECLFFRPVFNIADSFITVAVFLIIIFYRKDLDESLNQIFPKKEVRG